MATSSSGGTTRTFLRQPLAVILLASAATLFAANHIGARIAFDDGAGVPLAVLLRSLFATLLMSALVLLQRQRLVAPKGGRRWLLGLGLMIAGQSICLYSAVATIPVAMALLLMNTWPILLTLLIWLLGGSRPSAGMVAIMAITLCGMVLVLDVPGWLNRPDTLTGDSLRGAALALTAALCFAVAVWITENRLSGMNGAVRSAFTMILITLLMALSGALGLLPGSFQTPAGLDGWLGLAALMLFYGVASTTVFVLMPRLNMARNAPVMNFETVASLLLAYWVLDQTFDQWQLLGGTVVFGCILWLGVFPPRTVSASRR